MELRKILSNGVEVIASTNPHLHSFCATVRVRAGSAYEKLPEHGITHLMEHCVLRGLKGRFDEDYYVLQSRSGVRFDARTNPVRTEYEVAGHPQGIPLAAEIIRKMFLPIILSPREFHLEKDRVLAEMARRTPGGYNDFIAGKTWEGTAANRPVFGSAAKVRRFSRNQINAYRESILVPGNVQLCLTGCIDEDELALLMDAAESIPMYGGQPNPQELPRPKNFGKRELLLNGKVNFDYLQFIFDVDEEKCPRAVAELLREILFRNDDALLYRQLSEKTGLVYNYDWSYLEYRGFGITEFGFYYDFKRIGDVMEAVRCTMKRLADGEFDLSGKQFALRSEWERGLDDPVLLNSRMLYNLDLSDTPEPPAWDKVTKEEVISGARAMLDSGVIAFWHQAEWAEVAEALRPYFALDETKPKG